MFGDQAYRRRSWKIWLAVAYSVACGLFLYGLFSDRPWVAAATNRSLSIEHASRGLLSKSFNPNAARLYFLLNPDVAQHSYYGWKGPFGLRGAFLHFETFRHRGERVWVQGK